MPELFPDQEQFEKNALDPTATIVPPPPVDAARLTLAWLPSKVQLRKVASARCSVTAPAMPAVSEKPLRKVRPSKVTGRPRVRQELMKRTMSRAPPPSRTTVAPAVARMVKPLPRSSMANPPTGDEYVPPASSITSPSFA